MREAGYAQPSTPHQATLARPRHPLSQPPTPHAKARVSIAQQMSTCLPGACGTKRNSTHSLLQLTLVAQQQRGARSYSEYFLKIDN